MDYGHEWTEKELKKLEKRLAKEYKQAFLDIKKKADDYFKQFEQDDKKKFALMDQGKITRDEYLKWRQQQMLTGKQYQNMRDSLAKDFSNVNQIASKMINDNNKNVYATNYNFGTYEVEKGAKINTNFTLYDKDTVENLLKNDPKLLPKAKINITKDQKWNRNKINSALTQGILQGESIDKIANRLKSVTDMNRNSAIRNARTMTTGAENAGRVASYERADDLGIQIKQKWMATIDDRTRHSHIMMDGETVDVGEVFSNGCRFPADPFGEPEEVYNCRCTLVAEIEGHNYNDNRTSEKDYEKWKAGKE